MVAGRTRASGDEIRADLWDYLEARYRSEGEFEFKAREAAEELGYSSGRVGAYLGSMKLGRKRGFIIQKGYSSSPATWSVEHDTR